MDAAGSPGHFWTVTSLADELGITPRTVRFYEDKGLITPRRAGTTRVYTARDRARMILILRGKRLGFSLRDIKDFLDLYDVDTTQVEQMRLLLAAVRRRIADLEEQSVALAQSLDELREIEQQAERVVQPHTEQVVQPHAEQVVAPQAENRERIA